MDEAAPLGRGVQLLAGFLPSAMTANQDVAERLALMAKLMDLLGEDSFRASAHARAARAVEDFPGDLAELARDKKALTAIEGIGAKTADKIIECLTTGRIAELDRLREKVPAGLLDIMNIPGVGPKTVRAMWESGGVTDMASLKRAIEDGSLLKVPRMGEKAVEKIKANLVLGEEAGKRTPIGLAMPIARQIAAALAAVRGVERTGIAGSLRRGKETIGDIDVLVVMGREGLEASRHQGIEGHDSKADDEAIPAVVEAFCSLPGVRRVLSKGAGRASVRHSLKVDTGRWGFAGEESPESEPTIQVDVRVVPKESFGAAMMYFTGSKEHNVKLRERAQKRGLTLNEYGLFKEDGKTGSPHARGAAAVAGREEAEVFAALGVPYVPPEIREDQGELDLTQTPRLIELGDLKAELHAHTTASDGRMSLRELVEHIAARGFHTLAVTDHSKSSAVANGLSEARLRDQIKQIRELDQEIRESKPGEWGREKAKGLRVLAGSEVDILSDGRLDYDDELLAELDVVVASPHAALSQEPAAATARLVRAVSHPLVHILGHPTGRLVNRRIGLQPDLKLLFEAARAHGTALEINSHWMRLDLRDVHVRQALAAGCMIAIDCDVHEKMDSTFVEFGVTTGRRGGLTPERCINTLEVGPLLRWLAAKRGR